MGSFGPVGAAARAPIDVLIALHAEQPTWGETLDTNAWARHVLRTIAAIRPCVAQPSIHLADAIPIQWLGLGDYAVGLSGAAAIHICEVRAFTIAVARIVLYDASLPGLVARVVLQAMEG